MGSIDDLCGPDVVLGPQTHRTQYIVIHSPLSVLTLLHVVVGPSSCNDSFLSFLSSGLLSDILSSFSEIRGIKCVITD